MHAHVGSRRDADMMSSLRAEHRVSLSEDARQRRGRTTYGPGRGEGDRLWVVGEVARDDVDVVATFEELDGGREADHTWRRASMSRVKMRIGGGEGEGSPAPRTTTCLAGMLEGGYWS